MHSGTRHIPFESIPDDALKRRLEKSWYEILLEFLIERHSYFNAIFYIARST